MQCLFINVSTAKCHCILNVLISLYMPSRSLRSEADILLQIPRYKKLIGQMAFSVSAPKIWNSLPWGVRQSSTLAIFKLKLKNYLLETQM